jgi:DHA2 family multidrug resistance protein
MGTSITTTLWDDRATLHHAHLTEKLALGDTAMNEVMQLLTRAGLSVEQAALQVNRLIDQQAFTRAADDIFLGSVWMFLILIPVVWMSRPVMTTVGATDVGADAGGAH